MSIPEENALEKVPFKVNEISVMAIQAKTDRSIIPALWNRVERLIYKFCNKYLCFIEESGRFEYSDLVQESYLQFEYAVKKYDPVMESQFTSFLVFAVKRAFQIVNGTRTSKQDVFTNAVSLSEPLTDEDDYTLEDTLKDESSADQFKAIEDKEAVEFILEQVDKLKNGTQRFCFTEYAYNGKSMNNIAETLLLTPQSIEQYIYAAAANLRKNPFMRAAYPEYYKRPPINFYTAKGLKAFQSSLSSSVEDTVERIEFLDLIYGKQKKRG